MKQKTTYRGCGRQEMRATDDLGGPTQTTQLSLNIRSLPVKSLNSNCGTKTQPIIMFYILLNLH
jgi:hypothetical protein